MKRITVNAYRFEELSPTAKDHVRQHSGVGREVSERIMFWEDDRLPEAGFANARISCSFAGRQGDGACFDADIRLGKFAAEFLGEKHPAHKALLSRVFEKYLKATIRTTEPCYCHENTRRVVAEDGGMFYGRPRLARLMEELEARIEHIRLETAMAMGKDIGEAFLRADSDENLERIHRGTWFFEDGRIAR
jgi:hypothetical protein